MKSLLTTIMLFLASQIASATNYYVSAIGSDSNNGKSAKTPFKNIQTAADLTNPGDTVYIMNGTYTQTLNRHSNWLTVMCISRSGEENKYITYKAYPGHKPLISAVNACWNAVAVFANYIVIDGLEMIGKNATTTLAEAEANYDYALANEVAGTKPDNYRLGLLDINAVTIGQKVDSIGVKHHIEVKNCKVHDFSACGLNAINADNIIFENNEVYNNSWYTMWACSGISVINLVGNGTCIFRGNTVYNNECRVKWLQIKKYSDGNGIIIDVNKEYNGNFLVENNLVYNNGGRGLYIMDAGNAVFRNNISFWNSKSSFSTGGEMVCFDAYNVTYVNNIAWANPAYSPDNYALNDDGNWGANKNITWKNNITFNGTVGDPSTHFNKTTTTAVDNTNKLGINPSLVNPAIITLRANFHFKSDSPAIDAGTNTLGVSSFDMDYKPRVKGKSIDIGAYEMQ